MRSEAYLNEIRQAQGLKRAVLKKIVVEGKRVVFHLITDLTYREEDVLYARGVSGKYVPEGCTADVEIVKSVPDPEGVRAVAAEYLRKKFPAAAAFITPSDIEVAVDRAGGRFVLLVSETERTRFHAGDVLNALAAQLGRMFCGAWVGEYRTVEKRSELEHAPIPPAEIVRAPRVFPIVEYSAVDGADPKTALCIADLSGEMQGVTLCGTVTRIEERLTKKDKPFFRISLSDPTGQTTVSYFSKKATLEKVRGVKAGDKILLTGSNELFNGAYSFTARSLDYGSPSPDFVIEERVSRPVPVQYTAVQPETIADPVQDDLFGGKSLPARLLAEKFVVFDLETTGLNSTPVGGVMDRIIEVGAVKIEQGRICERFSTFVACDQKLSAEIVKLTGISDEMLEGAPVVGSVIADFFRFCDGCTLVAHNAAFDTAFIRFYGEQEGYLFRNKHYDTVDFAREVLPGLSNYKLNTIADHYKFTFNHHRAFDDAFVTAKIFLELAKEKGDLPKEW